MLLISLLIVSIEMLDGFMLDCNGYGPLLSMKETETLVCSEEQKQEMMEYLDKTRAKDA